MAGNARGYDNQMGARPLARLYSRENQKAVGG